jgi:hypothetical protein
MRRGCRVPAVVADANGPPQRPSIDQDRNDGLRHTDQGEHEKFSVVEDGEGSDASHGKSKKKHLDSRTDRMLAERLGARGAIHFPAERSGETERGVGHAPLALVNAVKKSRRVLGRKRALGTKPGP